jgi:tetratricopeptide (TPR) repeat protein
VLAAPPLAAAAKKDKEAKGKDAAAPASADPVRAAIEGKTAAERIEYLNGVIDAGEATKEVWFHLGNARYESGDPALAATAFEKAVAMDSTFFKALVNLGLMYDEQQNYSKAIEAFEAAAAIEPTNPDVWSHMGNTYYSQNQFAKATELYHKALGIQPDAVHALYSMGVAFADAGIFREAVSYWKRVVELDPQGELGKNAAENVELVQKYLIP